MKTQLHLLTLIIVASAAAENGRSAAKNVDIKSADGTIVKATYFVAPIPGPGVLLFHQSNRNRKSWDDVATKLAAAGINTLTVDACDPGSGKRTPASDLDTAFEFLISQPRVNRDTISLGGAGVIGVENSVETARRHTDRVKSLVLISGETSRPGRQFLHEASQLPGLFVFADNDEYRPIQEAMALLYDTSTSPSKKLVHYPAVKIAPWLWYEPFDIGKVPATGGHGTDLFKPHPELPAIIVNWFETTLIKTPGHAPADPLACVAILNQLETPGGVTQATQQLIEARRTDPLAQLFPEINVDIIASGYLGDGETNEAIEIFKLNLLAYPDSADAHYNLADAYLKDGQKDLARQYAQKALAMLDSHAAPLSSWSDTEPRRAEIRRGILDTLKKIGEEK